MKDKCWFCGESGQVIRFNNAIYDSGNIHPLCLLRSESGEFPPSLETGSMGLWQMTNGI